MVRNGEAEVGQHPGFNNHKERSLMVNTKPNTNSVSPQQPTFGVPTALPYGAPDDGDPGRQQRGLAIAAVARLEKHRLGYKVPSQSGNGTYVVNTDDDPICTCPDFERRQAPCKHIYAVQIVIQREELPDGTVVEQVATTTTYRQAWPAYNAAQEHEAEHFGQLLRELCDTVPQPQQTGKGRPRLPMSDKVFAAALKVYGTKSTRRSMGDIRDAEADGLMDKAPSCGSTFRSMEDPAMAPVLESLIELSARPLRAIEQDFAPDSTGFASQYYTRWFDEKWGKTRSMAVWTKAHAFVGVTTNVVTAARVTAHASGDAPFLEELLDATARSFPIREVSADKAYLSRGNLQAIEDAGGRAYIPFKSNSKSSDGKDAVWDRALHLFALQRADFDAHYHKRSNAETAFHMVKAKFGAMVRSKREAARVNEVLLKFLCHNICVVIQTAYELGAESVIGLGAGTFGATALVAPKITPN